MTRPVTLFTGQWTDLAFDVICASAKKYGYDGVEIAAWGGHFDVNEALSKDAYVASRHDILAQHGMKVWAISNHLVGQAVCDRIDQRHKSILPAHVWGDGKEDGVRPRAAQRMKGTARASGKVGVTVVPGFTGSSVWPLLYSFPPVPDAWIDAGFEDFAAR